MRQKEKVVAEKWMLGITFPVTVVELNRSASVFREPTNQFSGAADEFNVLTVEFNVPVGLFRV